MTGLTVDKMEMMKEQGWEKPFSCSWLEIVEDDSAECSTKPTYT